MKIFVANWKMQRSFDESLSWIDEHKSSLKQLITSTTKLVICPEFTTLKSIYDKISGTGIELGAQNCAAQVTGSYTGEVSAKSLKEVGCSYCIIGHSEHRRLSGETFHDVGLKLVTLLRLGVTPIICVGESANDHKEGATHDVLQVQLEPIVDGLLDYEKLSKSAAIIVAYEPLWAIGSGATPNNLEIINALKTIRDYLKEQTPNCSVQLLYGGSVNEQTLVELKKIKELDGFLIGSASLDFQNLKKIVVSHIE